MIREQCGCPDADGAALCNALSNFILADFMLKFQTKNLQLWQKITPELVRDNHVSNSGLPGDGIQFWKAFRREYIFPECNLLIDSAIILSNCGH